MWYNIIVCIFHLPDAFNGFPQECHRQLASKSLAEIIHIQCDLVTILHKSHNLRANIYNHGYRFIGILYKRHKPKQKYIIPRAISHRAQWQHTLIVYQMPSLYSFINLFILSSKKICNFIGERTDKQIKKKNAHLCHPSLNGVPETHNQERQKAFKLC